MYIVPLRQIKKGERLTWNYLPYWKWLWPTHLRRQALKEGWDFLCRCPRCEPPELSDSKLEVAVDRREKVMSYRCPACGQGDLCPASPCIPAAIGDVQASGGGSCCGASHLHEQALQAISTLECSC